MSKFYYRFIFMLSLLCCFIIHIQAVIPPGYYNLLEGTKERELKTALHLIIKDAKVLKYGGQGVGYTWQGFSVTDTLPEGYVLDRYSDVRRKFVGIKAVSGMNIEHAFANSWWGKIENQAYKDLHHLYPSDGSANIRKSNHPIGVVDGSNPYDNGVIKVGQSSSRPGGTITAWEPADQYKGDFARTYMYMVTCYEDFADIWKGDGLLMLENNTYPVFQKWAYDLLLKWNEEDPVDELELERNEAVYDIQGNRNPFIDYPQLAEYIWGNKTSTAFYTEEDNEHPELFVPQNNSVIDFGMQALSVPSSKTFTIRGRNLTDDLVLTCTGDVFNLSKVSFSPSEVAEGKEVTIEGIWKTIGEQEAVLTLTYGQNHESVTLKANVWDGIPAYDAKDIVCNPYVKSFVASWMKMPDIPYVSLDVYTKTGEGSQSLSGFPKDVVSSDTIVKVSKAATTYYYKVMGGGMESNEIEVVMPVVLPVFTASVTEMSFFTAPLRPSFAQQVKLTMQEMKNYRTDVTTVFPFELSSDGVVWSNELTLNGKDQNFFVRLNAVEEGMYEEEIILSTPDVDDDIVINALGEVNKEKPFFENFENGTKSSYAAAAVNCTSASWILTDALIGGDDNDKKNDLKSVRMYKNGSLEMVEPKMNGIGTVSFFVGTYGTNAASGFSVYYNINDGEWIPIKENVALVKGEYKQYSYPVNQEGNVRLKLIQTNGSSSKRINIDDIAISDYTTSSHVNIIENSSCTYYTAPGQLHIVSNRDITMELYSLQGVLLTSKLLNVGENLYSLSSGAYILKIDKKSFVICL